MKEPSAVGRRLKEARLLTHPPVGVRDDPPTCGWQCVTQRQLSIWAGMSDGLVGHLERGETPGLGDETAVKFGEILGVTLDWLRAGKKPAHPNSDELSVEVINQAARAARLAAEEAA
jgi:hypothetical protein